MGISNPKNLQGPHRSQSVVGDFMDDQVVGAVVAAGMSS